MTNHEWRMYIQWKPSCTACRLESWMIHLTHPEQYQWLNYNHAVFWESKYFSPHMIGRCLWKLHESHQLSCATLVEHPNCLMIGIALLNSYMTPERDIVKQWKHRPLNSCYVIFIVVHICHISDLLNSVDSCNLLLQFLRTFRCKIFMSLNFVVEKEW